MRLKVGASKVLSRHGKGIEEELPDASALFPTKLNHIEALTEESYKTLRTLVRFFFSFLFFRCNSSPPNALRSCDHGRGHATLEDPVLLHAIFFNPML
jgi:hypothetical protein